MPNQHEQIHAHQKCASVGRLATPVSISNSHDVLEVDSALLCENASWARNGPSKPESGCCGLALGGASFHELARIRDTPKAFSPSRYSDVSRQRFGCSCPISFSFAEQKTWRLEPP